MSPLILLTSIILKGEISEHQVDDVLSTIVGYMNRLKQWEELLEHPHTPYQHDVPFPISMNIDKLGSSGALTSDTCNGARKTRRLIAEKVFEAAKYFCKDDSDDIRVLEVDCWNKLRNLWLGGMTRALSPYLTTQ